MDQNMPKAKKFKLAIMKAFQEDETRKLQKDVLGALIDDELTPEELPVASSPRDVTLSQPALSAPQAQAALPEPAKVDEPAVSLSELKPLNEEEAQTAGVPEAPAEVTPPVVEAVPEEKKEVA